MPVRIILMEHIRRGEFPISNLYHSVTYQWLRYDGQYAWYAAKVGLDGMISIALETFSISRLIRK
jgi:hypothetical protein